MNERYTPKQALAEAGKLQNIIESGDASNYSEAENLLERQKSEKLAHWDKIFQEVQEYQDGAGNKMEKGIIELVTALTVHDIPTLQSCAGHTDGPNRGAMPWVQIQQPGRPRDISRKEDVTPEWKRWREQELALQERVHRLLEAFNSSQEANPDISLILNWNDIVATSKDIEEILADDPYGIKVLPKQEEAKRVAKILPFVPLAQEIMRAFSAYLKEQYLGEQ